MRRLSFEFKDNLMEDLRIRQNWTVAGLYANHVFVYNTDSESKPYRDVRPSFLYAANEHTGGTDTWRQISSRSSTQMPGQATNVSTQ